MNKKYNFAIATHKESKKSYKILHTFWSDFLCILLYLHQQYSSVALFEELSKCIKKEKENNNNDLTYTDYFPLNIECSYIYIRSSQNPLIYSDCSQGKRMCCFLWNISLTNWQNQSDNEKKLKRLLYLIHIETFTWLRAQLFCPTAFKFWITFSPVVWR